MRDSSREREVCDENHHPVAGNIRVMEAMGYAAGMVGGPMVFCVGNETGAIMLT